MATGTNAIATESEVKTATASTATVTGNKCCTKTRAVAICSELQRVLSAYSDNQLIKYQDVSTPEQVYSGGTTKVYGAFYLSSYSSYKSFSMKYTIDIIDHTGKVVKTFTGTSSTYVDDSTRGNWNPFRSGYSKGGYIAMTSGQISIATGSISTGISRVRCKVEFYGVAKSSTSSNNSNLITYGYGNVSGSKILRSYDKTPLTEYYEGQYYLTGVFPAGNFGSGSSLSTGDLLFYMYETDSVYNNRGDLEE